ncbi:MAG: hypothetical protein AB8H03_18300 [Saprospiraceae bacterium]
MKLPNQSQPITRSVSNVAKSKSQVNPSGCGCTFGCIGACVDGVCIGGCI